MARDVIFNYATNYRVDNSEITSAKEFTINDTEYKRFSEYALTQEFDYKTATEEYFKQLKEVAEKEKYYADAELEFNALLTEITPDKTKDLEKYKGEIIESGSVKDVLSYPSHNYTKKLIYSNSWISE